MIVFIEKCLLLVDGLGRTGKCYIEVEQKGWLPPPPPLATPLALISTALFCFSLLANIYQVVLLDFVIN